MLIIDRLVSEIIRKKNPSVIGLDPDLRKIPLYYKRTIELDKNPLISASKVIIQFNMDIIDTICELVPAVKLQIAFYEKYGSVGIKAFEDTVHYAKSKGLIVIEDGKRNDIGNTALAYAQAHLGKVETIEGNQTSSFDVDFLTISPFLGNDGIIPFVNVCDENNKGIFILVKTSNNSSSEIQDAKKDGMSISEYLAQNVAHFAEHRLSNSGYSSIGAVVGATFPNDAILLRKLMPKSFFLVPGYGVQGGTDTSILPCFNNDGLGALINSSRGILYQHMSEEKRCTCDKNEYLSSVYRETLKMRNSIYKSMKVEGFNICY